MLFTRRVNPVSTFFGETRHIIVDLGSALDTTSQLENVSRIVLLLDASGVDRIVHTGDITQAKTLVALACLEAPLTDGVTSAA